MYECVRERETKLGSRKEKEREGGKESKEGVVGREREWEREREGGRGRTGKKREKRGGGLRECVSV